MSLRGKNDIDAGREYAACGRCLGCASPPSGRDGWRPIPFCRASSAFRVVELLVSVADIGFR
jgi:hypothetical protein